jgi:hypothetical protein
MDCDTSYTFSLLLVERGKPSTSAHPYCWWWKGIHSARQYGRAVCIPFLYCWWLKEVHLNIHTIDDEMNTPCTSICWRWNGYTLHVHTAGIGKGCTLHVHVGYTLHVHTAGDVKGYIHHASHSFGCVKRYTLHRLLVVFFLLYDIEKS